MFVSYVKEDGSVGYFNATLVVSVEPVINESTSKSLVKMNDGQTLTVANKQASLVPKLETAATASSLTAIT